MYAVTLHPDAHFASRTGWLRAAVVGAKGGIVPTASLIVGVSAAATAQIVLIAVVAPPVAGAIAVAAGEYDSVSSQTDTEQADLNRERSELCEEVRGTVDGEAFLAGPRTRRA